MDEQKQIHVDLVAACVPFVALLMWLEALVENGEMDTLKEHDVICQYSGGGGHAALTVGELRTLWLSWEKFIKHHSIENIREF